jgi:hypothetical protein
MLYPPKKRAYSPESKKTKDLSNLMNINSKFTGSGGSNFTLDIDSSSLAPKKTLSVPKPSVSGIFKPDKYVRLQYRNLGESTLFKKYYDRGDLPVAVSFHRALRQVLKY